MDAPFAKCKTYGKNEEENLEKMRNSIDSFVKNQQNS